MESKRIEYQDRIEWENRKGQFHRLDGPAIEWKSGTKSWYINGQRHREDGPARELKDGRKEWWWLNGIEYTEEQWKEEVVKLKLNRIKDL